MPNYVYTKAIVSGPPADIDKMKAACFYPEEDRDGIDFERAYPTPDPVPEPTAEMWAKITFECLGPYVDEMKETQKTTGSLTAAQEERFEKAKAFAIKTLERDPRGSWQRFHWGSNRVFTSTYKNRQIYLVTAWGAPIGIFMKIAERFPTLSFGIKTEEEQGEFFQKGTINASGVKLEHDKDAEASWELDGYAGTFDLNGTRYHEENVA